MSTYQHMDHAGWLERNLDHPLSPTERKVADILGMTFGGIYNAPINFSRGWKALMGGRAVQVVVGDRSMATYDFNQLTMLVFLCHEARIRCELSCHGPRYLKLMFSQRAAEGGMAQRHPNLDEAVQQFREYLPAAHPIIYSDEPSCRQLQTI